MNPYLTRSGRWILLSGFAFLFVGILLSDWVVVVLGQIHIVLLACAHLMCAPAALALDRRLVSLEVEPGDAEGVGTGHVVGDTIDVRLEVDNRAAVSLPNFRALPFGGEGLELPDQAPAAFVPSNHRSAIEFSLRGGRCGRWMLHGFDVVVSDPFGLVESRDYLSAMHAFEFYPNAGRLRGRRPLRYRASVTPSSGGRHLVHELGSGTDIRELRDYQPGDSLRDVAWKATVRARKLISRDFEREVTTHAYVALDVSSSMRGGHWPGQKLEYALHLCVDFIESVLKERDHIGLVTFDEKLYGHIPPGNSMRHFQRVLHHLVGLNSIIDPELTELDELEVERLAADYLLVQERLDFRQGAEPDAPSGVNTKLLGRWLSGVMDANRQQFDSPVLREGVVDAETSPLRSFLQMRGVEIPYRVEARLGMKERGLAQSLGHIVRQARRPHWIVVVSDLCGVMNLDTLLRGVRLALAEGHRLHFVVPFTPAFYGPKMVADEKWEVIQELFTTAEAEERGRIANRIRALGVPVDFIEPSARELEQI